jgi:hypothetical protein
MRYAANLAVIALVLAGCSSSRTTGSQCGDPCPPFTITLTHDNPVDLYRDGYHMVATVHANSAMKDASVGITVPEGVQVLSGEATKRNPMSAGNEARVNLLVKTTNRGSHTFTAWAEDLGVLRPGGRVASAMAYTFVGSADGATSAPATPPPLPFGVAASAHGSGTSTIRATIHSPVAAHVRVVLGHQGMTIQQGLEGTTLIFDHTGDQTLDWIVDDGGAPGVASVWAYPDAAIDTGVYSTEIQVN